MAATDITLASTLKAPTGYAPEILPSGEAITAGMAVYRKTSTDNKLYKAIATSQEAANAIGIALASAPGADQPIPLFKSGELSNLSSLVQGEAYFVSDTTAGALMKGSDIGAGEYVTFMGIAKTTAILSVHIFTPGVAHS